MFFNFKSFVSLCWFLDRDMRKKIQSETLNKSQFLFFSENPIFCGSNFVLWVRGGKFQNFDTRIGSYS